MVHQNVVVNFLAMLSSITSTVVLRQYLEYNLYSSFLKSTL